MDAAQITSDMSAAVTWESLIGVLSVLAAVMTGVNALVIRYFTDRSSDHKAFYEALKQVVREQESENEKIHTRINELKDETRDRLDRTVKSLRDETVSLIEKMEARLTQLMVDNRIQILTSVAEYKRDQKEMLERLTRGPAE